MKTLEQSGQYIAKDTLEGLPMCVSQSLHKMQDLIDRIGQIKTSGREVLEQPHDLLELSWILISSSSK